MSDISDWSATPANNNSTPPDGAPEGCAPSTVNDIIRECMAAIRRWYEDAAWVDYGYTYTRISSGSFSIVGDYTSSHHVGRRVKMSGSATAYGTIGASTYSAPNTTIELLESTVPATLDSVALSIITNTNSPMPYGADDYARLSASNTFTSTIGVTLSSAQPEIRWYESDGATNEKYWRCTVANGNWVLQSLDDTYSSGNTAINVDRSGNTVTTVTFMGNAVAINYTNPRLRFYDSDGGTNEKYYSWEADAAGFGLYFRTDALGSGSIPISIARTGTVCDSITLAATLTTIATSGGTGSVTVGSAGEVTFSNSPVTAVAKYSVTPSFQLGTQSNHDFDLYTNNLTRVQIRKEGGLRTLPTTVGSLPSASTVGAGTRHFVTDANATTFASIVAGGGSNNVPVYSDGTNWRIG